MMRIKGVVWESRKGEKEVENGNQKQGDGKRGEKWFSEIPRDGCDDITDSPCKLVSDSDGQVSSPWWPRIGNVYTSQLSPTRL